MTSLATWARPGRTRGHHRPAARSPPPHRFPATLGDLAGRLSQHHHVAAAIRHALRAGGPGARGRAGAARRLATTPCPRRAGRGCSAATADDPELWPRWRCCTSARWPGRRTTGWCWPGRCATCSRTRWRLGRPRRRCWRPARPTRSAASASGSAAGCPGGTKQAAVDAVAARLTDPERRPRPGRRGARRPGRDPVRPGRRRRRSCRASTATCPPSCAGRSSAGCWSPTGGSMRGDAARGVPGAARARLARPVRPASAVAAARRRRRERRRARGRGRGGGAARRRDRGRGRRADRAVEVRRGGCPRDQAASARRPVPREFEVGLLHRVGGRGRAAHPTNDEVLPTPEYDEWLAEPPAARLATLVDAWFEQPGCGSTGVAAEARASACPAPRACAAPCWPCSPSISGALPADGSLLLPLLRWHAPLALDLPDDDRRPGRPVLWDEATRARHGRPRRAEPARAGRCSTAATWRRRPTRWSPRRPSGRRSRPT